MTYLELNFENGENISNAAERIPDGVTHLDLRQCKLYDLNQPQLIIFLKSLHNKGIEILDIGTNDLGLLDNQSISNIFKAISVPHLKLTMNYLGYVENIGEIFTSLPSNVISIDITNNNWDVLTEENKNKLIDGLLESGKQIIIEKSIAEQIDKAQIFPLFKMQHVRKTFGKNGESNPLAERNLLKEIINAAKRTTTESNIPEQKN